MYCTFNYHKNLTYDSTCKSVHDYFNPKICNKFQIHKFRKCSQKENESIDEYHMRLQNLAENYEFHDKDV